MLAAMPRQHYMSTNKLTLAELEAMCLGSGAQLERWRVRGGRAPPAGRGLYLMKGVHAEIYSKPWPRAAEDLSDLITAKRRAAMHAVLERFAIGHAMIIRSDMKELGTLQRRQDFRGWWEIRSQGPMTETRLFGFFALPGAFIGVDFQPRDRFGGRNDPQWAIEHTKCISLWNGLSPGCSKPRTSKAPSAGSRMSSRALSAVPFGAQP